LFEEALRRGAKQVYAGTRQPLRDSDRRVTPLTLNVTNAAQIQGAVEEVESLDIPTRDLVNAFLTQDTSEQPLEFLSVVVSSTEPRGACKRR
jgi:hypothetical protein